MKTFAAFCLLLLPVTVFSDERSETHELVGQLGSRTVLVVLHATQRPDSGWQVAGEYVILPTLTRRFLEGERSPQLGVTTLKEGTSAILFGHPATGELRGTWRGGVFKGTRYGPGGQERERFEFSEKFAAMDGYSAAVRCDADAGRYASTLAFTIQSGKLNPGSFEWRSKLSPGGHGCNIEGLEQQPFEGGLRFASGRCSVTLREVGDHVKAAAENCAERCGSEAYVEPLLVDRRGQCRLLHEEQR